MNIQGDLRKPEGSLDPADVTVIIPAKDEPEGLRMVLEELLSEGMSPGGVVVVVPRGGHGPTADVAKDLDVPVVEQDRDGKANAVMKGIQVAETEYVFLMDADHTYPARHIKDLLSKIGEGYDHVIGWRAWGEGFNGLFRVGNFLLTKAFNLLFGTGLHDVLSGMYITRKRALRDALFEMRGFSVEAEIAAHVASTTGRIAEVPIEYRRRVGEKKVGVRHGFTIAYDMIRLALRYNPLLLFYSLVALLLVPGALIGAWVTYRLLFDGVKHYVWGLIALILVASGFNGLMLASLMLYFKRLEMRLRRFMEGRDYLRSSR